MERDRQHVEALDRADAELLAAAQRRAKLLDRLAAADRKYKDYVEGLRK